MIGELIDHYRVLELVGRGAMGVVYKALDVNLDRQVAIKVMSAEARNDPDFVERFRQEARMQGALNHPNVAMLFDYFIHDGAPVAVMELIDGESLEQLIRRRGAIPAHESIPIFKQALRGVAAAHRAGIIHRDLKPSNLMVTRDDIVKVMDFGIAKRQGAPGATKVSSTSIGSPLYMAPEQILGRAVDRRTDVYALGLTLYELLSGHRPFNPRGKAEFMVLNAHVNDLPEPPTVYRFGLPQPLVDAVMRSLAKDPAARFQSAEEFMGALPDIPAPQARAPQVSRSGTVALEYSPGEGTTAVEYAPSPAATASPAMAANAGPTGTLRLDAKTLDVDFTPAAAATKAASTAVAANAGPTGTLRLASAPRADSAPASPIAASVAQASRRPGLMRAYGPATVAVLVATLGLAAVLRHSERSQAPAPASTAAQTPPPAEPAAAAPSADAGSELQAAPAPADVTAATPVPAPATPVAATRAPIRPDLSGTWRGEYVDASGRQRLRVVSLSISRVRDDGGIEGTLQYEAASGDGECQLHPRRSTYSAGQQRLQLSPEGCSPHYPKELGVPLDFSGVNPRANTLRDGRIEAPTGELIRVRLRRVSGA